MIYFDSMQDYNNSLIRALNLSNKVCNISFENWKWWHNFMIDHNFCNVNFANLQMIHLPNSGITGHELNRFMRVLSKNESIRQNLGIILIKMIDIYDENMLFNLLKIKSYGFIQCKIIESSMDSKWKGRYQIDIFSPLIQKPILYASCS